MREYRIRVNAPAVDEAALGARGPSQVRLQVDDDEPILSRVSFVAI